MADINMSSTNPLRRLRVGRRLLAKAGSITMPTRLTAQSHDRGELRPSGSAAVVRGDVATATMNCVGLVAFIAMFAPPGNEQVAPAGAPVQLRES